MSNANATTALVIDCRSRDLQTFTASVTEAADKGLVLRKAAELGRLKDLSGAEIPQTIILLGDYVAQSSAGFTRTYLPKYYYRRFLSGGSGFGWEKEGKRKGDALRRIRGYNGEQIPVVVIHGAVMVPIEDHKNSNVATADAALAGLELRASLRKEVVLAEGQSDYVRGWAFKPITNSRGIGGDFPPEHQVGIFPAPAATPAPGTGMGPANDNDFVEVQEG